MKKYERIERSADTATFSHSFSFSFFRKFVFAFYFYSSSTFAHVFVLPLTMFTVITLKKTFKFPIYFFFLLLQNKSGIFFKLTFIFSCFYVLFSHPKIPIQIYNTEFSILNLSFHTFPSLTFLFLPHKTSFFCISQPNLTLHFFIQILSLKNV